MQLTVWIYVRHNRSVFAESFREQESLFFFERLNLIVFFGVERGSCLNLRIEYSITLEAHIVKDSPVKIFEQSPVVVKTASVISKFHPVFISELFLFDFLQFLFQVLLLPPVGKSKSINVIVESVRAETRSALKQNHCLTLITHQDIYIP